MFYLELIKSELSSSSIHTHFGANCTYIYVLPQLHYHFHLIHVVASGFLELAFIVHHVAHGHHLIHQKVSSDLTVSTKMFLRPKWPHRITNLNSCHPIIYDLYAALGLDFSLYLSLGLPWYRFKSWSRQRYLQPLLCSSYCNFYIQK